MVACFKLFNACKQEIFQVHLGMHICSVQTHLYSINVALPIWFLCW